MESQGAPIRIRRKTLGVIACIIAAIACIVFFGVREYGKRREAIQVETLNEIHQTGREMAEEFQRELDNSGVVPSLVFENGRDRVRRQLDQAAMKLGRNDEMLRFAEEVFAEMQAKSAPQLALIKRWNDERPMEMAAVRNLDDLASRRAFGQEMLRANAEFITYLNSFETSIRAKLAKQGKSTASVNETLAYLMKNAGPSLEIIRRIRRTDQIQAESLIQMADLMEAQWGKWKSTNGVIIFERDDAADRYSEIVAATNRSDEERIAAQRELFERQQRLSR